MKRELAFLKGFRDPSEAQDTLAMQPFSSAAHGELELQLVRLCDSKGYSNENWSLKACWFGGAGIPHIEAFFSNAARGS